MIESITTGCPLLDIVLKDPKLIQARQNQKEKQIQAYAVARLKTVKQFQKWFEDNGYYIGKL